MDLQVDTLVTFGYREMSEHGKDRVSSYTGWIEKLYRNGQFLLTNRHGMEPQRFERCAIVKKATDDNPIY